MSDTTANPTAHIQFDEEAVAQDAQARAHEAPRRVGTFASSVLKQRRGRSDTFTTVHEILERPEWAPGREPGLDAHKEDGGRADKPVLQRACQITVVDFDETQLQVAQYANDDFIAMMDKLPGKPLACRWISVNHLSWDVIACIGRAKGLHRLSVEDLLNIHNRAKVDFYSDHTFAVMTLQKLVELHTEENSDDEDDSSNYIPRRLKKLFRRPRAKYQEYHNEPLEPETARPRTIQRYRAGPNEEKMAFMERHSTLAPRQLCVVAEQVSLYYTADNEIISFFEASADDVEKPILARLMTPDTILRKAADASMLLQAIIDAIVDLSIPVLGAMQDSIGSLELDVLTHPEIEHAKRLYIATSEIATMRSYISPILGVVKALQDHGRSFTNGTGKAEAQRHDTAVTVSATTRTYLDDVSDHVILVTEGYDQLRRSADNLSDLVFNTMSAYQNEILQGLTNITVIFLPITALVGYFGMNFLHFDALERGIGYFWQIAAPVAVIVTLLVMRLSIWRFFRKRALRWQIGRRRAARLGAVQRRKR